ncbi:MAG: YfhO family protein [Eubacterium sp.]|nr:YfhO family protein [Eubacterium sp.]
MIRKAIFKHPYLCLTGLIFVTGLVLYAPYIFGPYLFVWADWGYDTKHGNLPMYEYLVQRICTGRFSQYDFTFGLGAGSAVSAGSLFDLFQILLLPVACLFGKQAVGYGLVYMHLCKNIMLGCIGLHYLRLFKFSSPVCIAAAYVLSFCGYVMVTGQHYEYATYAVIYCFVILMCEKAIRIKKWCAGLTASVFLMGLLGPYAAFWPLISAGVYCVVRVMQVQQGTKVRFVIRQIWFLSCYMVLGLLLSMFAFLPQCYEIFFVSSRMQQERSIASICREAFSLVPDAYLKSGFFRLFSNHLQGLINSWEGPKAYFSATPYFFSLFFPFCITHEGYKLVKGEKNRTQAVRFLVMLLVVFCFFFALFPIVSCGFAYIEYRFAFVFLPLFAFCFADTMEDLFYQKTFSFVVCILTGIFGCMILQMLFDSENRYSVLSLHETIVLLCLIMTGMVLIAKGRMKSGAQKTGMKLALCILIAASQWFDIGMELYAERSIMRKADYDTRYHMPYMEQFAQELEALEGDRFFRLDRTFVGYDGSPDILYSLVCPVRTASIYSNTLSRYALEFVDKVMKKEPMIGQNQIGYAIGSYGTCFDIHTAGLLGLKYIVSQEDTTQEGWKVISSYEGYYLYQKENMPGAGLLYNHYITDKDYEAMDASSQAAVTYQAVILDQDIKEKERNKLEVSDLDLKKTVQAAAEERETGGTGLCETRLDYCYADGLINTGFGSVVEGTLDVQGEPILYLPIVYDANWKVWINGKKADVYRANYGFMAVVLQDGVNHVIFRYSNSFFKVGAIVSTGSAVLTFIVFTVQKKNSRKRKEIR